MHELGGVPVGLAAVLREGVIAIGPGGTIEWANAAALAMLGVQADELVGTSMLDRLHPDEVARALDGILFSRANPDRTQIVPFRARRRDGTWLDVELMSSPISVDDGEHLLLVIRDATRRQALARALASVAAGGPIDETATWLARVVEARWGRAAIAAVLLDDRSGRRLVGAEQWDGPLREALHERGPGDELWRDAVAPGRVAVRSGDEIPDAVRDVASESGYSAFAVAPVPDPGGGTAVLVAWFDRADAASMEFDHGSGELRELLSLALERQHHLNRLDHAARHDELTGLLNRSGFVELVTQQGDGAADLLDGSAALLYLDLDGFKPVNDRYGHAVGDAVLRVVAGRLSALIGSVGLAAERASWSAARMGGDEFVLFGRGGETLADDATALAQAAVAAISEPIEVAGGDGDLVQVQIGASVGVAVTGAGGAVDELLDLADGAMYRVKAEGGHSWSARLPG